MLNPDQLRFRQEGRDFIAFNSEGQRGKRVFRSDTEVPHDDFKAAEKALKEFVIWCYDRRIAPVRA